MERRKWIGAETNACERQRPLQEAPLLLSVTWVCMALNEGSREPHPDVEANFRGQHLSQSMTQQSERQLSLEEPQIFIAVWYLKVPYILRTNPSNLACLTLNRSSFP